MTWQLTATAPVAHADYFSYPCQPPGVGTGVQIHVLIDVQGQFCDGPTEINLTHLHCESGGASVNIGAFALAPLAGSPLSLGGIGGGGIGGAGGGCSYRCPDNTVAPAPNPPGVGQRSYIDVRSIIKLNKAFCAREGHLIPAGPTSALVSPDEGFPPTKDPEPYQVGDPGVQVPSAARPPAPREDAEPAQQQPEGNIPVPSLPPVIPPVPQLPNIPGIPLPGQG